MRHFIILGILLLLVDASSFAQALPASISAEPANYNAQVARVLAKDFQRVASSQLDLLVSFSEMDMGEARGMETRTAVQTQATLRARHAGKTIVSDPITLHGAGTSTQAAIQRAFSTMRRQAAYKQWLAEVVASVEAAGACAAIDLLDLSAEQDAATTRTLARYIASVGQDSACHEASQAALDQLATRYAEAQCAQLDELDLLIRTKTYDRHRVTRQLRRIQPNSSCWTRALELAEEVGNDQLAAQTKSDWMLLFAKGAL